MDSDIHQINHYPVDSIVHYLNNWHQDLTKEVSFSEAEKYFSSQYIYTEVSCQVKLCRLHGKVYTRGAGMAQWWECLPPNNVAWVWILDPAS